MILEKLAEIHNILVQTQEVSKFAKFAASFTGISVAAIKDALKEAKSRTYIKNSSKEKYQQIIDLFEQYKDPNEKIYRYNRKLDKYWKMKGFAKTINR